MGTSIKHPVPNWVKPSFVIFDIRERQSARMSKITNNGLTWLGTGCFIDVPMWQKRASKDLKIYFTIKPSPAVNPSLLKSNLSTVPFH